MARLNARKKTVTQEAQQNDQQNDHPLPTSDDEFIEKDAIVETEAPSELKKSEDSDMVVDQEASAEKQDDAKETAESQADKENEDLDNHEGFTILDEVSKEKAQKAFRVLPNWLAKPSVISCDLSNNKVPIKKISGIDKFLVSALKRNKVQHFFPGITYSYKNFEYLTYQVA